MIETLASHGPDQAFAVRVRLWRHHGRADHPNACTLGDIVEDGSQLGIVVTEEKLRPQPKGGQLPKLLGQPVCAGGRGCCGEENAPGCEVHDDEYEVAAEPEVTSLEEVAGPDASALVPEERRPALAPRRPCAG